MSNNLTTSTSNTQGAVKRMTRLFYTSPSKKLVSTAKIDQLERVKKAINLGYKNIAVSVAASDNYLHKELAELEKNGVKIYKFGLRSTGTNKETAEIMKDYTDVIWTCAYKYVNEIVKPSSIAQVGIEIPVHTVNKKLGNIIKNHLVQINKDLDTDIVNLDKGEEKPVFLNSSEGIKILQKKYIYKWKDCPHPCI